MFQSSANRKPMPNRNPTAAGITLHLPLSASISIAGMSNDHTDAATITPEAKPNSDSCTRADISSFIKKHLVVFHEIGHALMDVELYGIHPSPHFSYSSDYVYRFIEEAYANGIALSIVYDNLKSQEQDFIKDFVLSQGAGYARGWDLRDYHLEIDQWLSIKVLFNYDIACSIIDCWKNNHQELVPECVQSVGHNDWLALKDRHDKWGIIELPSQKDIIGFKKYDSFWSFDENGLCMVRLDQQKGYLYGFVNEQGVEQIPVEYDHLYSFENGITIAKKDGRYGAIDLNNNTVIPFNLPYEDIRGFRNGRASVKDRNEKWGVIDTNGKLIVPCVNNNIVL